MIAVNYLAAAALFVLGAFVVTTRRHLIRIVMGLSLMESSTYLLVLSMAYRNGSTAPVLLSPPGGLSPGALAVGNVSDPVLQNFCLTAIVIGVAITGVFLVVVVRLAQHYRTLDAGQIRELQG